jgi:hypothetical protein
VAELIPIPVVRKGQLKLSERVESVRQKNRGEEREQIGEKVEKDNEGGK